MFDGKAFGAEIVGVVKDYVTGALSPITARLDALEKRIGEIPQPEKPDLSPFALKDDVPDTAPILAEIKELRDAIAAIPQPPEPQPPEKGERGEKGDPGNDGAPGRDGKDGCGVKDLLIDRDGRLVATLDDGRMKELGSVIGKDGSAGRDGINGKDGAPGRDGQDGVGFDDMNIETREDAIYMVWEKGDVVKEARLPLPLYRGVFKEDTGYYKGNTVTWGGSAWIAEVDAPKGKPDAPESGWRLAVKKGRDAKDNVVKTGKGN
jgi:hypothetical protein